LNIKFSQKKQDIRDDPVMDFFIKSKQYAVKYANILAGCGIALAAIGVIFFIYLQTRQAGSDKAQSGFGRAMIEFNNRNIEKAVEEFRTVAENYTATASGAESALMLGSIFFNSGRYDDALQWFEKAATHGTSLGFVSGEAYEGLASCYEAKGDIQKAMGCLDKALRDDGVRYRHAAIRWKMALMSRTLNDVDRVRALCNEIMSDTSAADYRQRAENLLAVLEAVPG
jgi:tetratricopeptide (TPR) repeat protein